MNPSARAERLRVLVVGNGGREHALAWKLAQSPRVDFVHVAPGNGGTQASDSCIENIDIKVDDFAKLVAHSKRHGINLVVPGPEAPLVAGIQSHFQNGMYRVPSSPCPSESCPGSLFSTAGIRCFGPSKAAAQLEGSKVLSKEFMQRNGIPTAKYQSFASYEEARKHLESVKYSVVIKADGLAAGKGVIIPKTPQEAQHALKEMMLNKEFGDAGSRVVIEEFLEGDEVSILSFCDGYTIRSLPPAQDHKRVYDGDEGPNTGGMGCYAPTPITSKELLSEIDRTIVQPTIDATRREGAPFVGLLFTGLMLTSSGPKVLEYNVRGGDPETQTLLPLLDNDTDLAEIMVACTEHWLDGVKVGIDQKFSATVVAAAEGYPGPYKKNIPMTLSSPPANTYVFHAGTHSSQNRLVTTGGRVIAAIATAATLEAAVSLAYSGLSKIKFGGMHFRKDIAHRALKPPSTAQQTSTTSVSAAPLTYASAGVSITAGNNLVSLIKPSVAATSRPGSSALIGGFGGAFSLADAGYGTGSPTLIAAIDGVGTKLAVAHALSKHDTVGIDLVAMNVNDLIVQGAEPLAFLDCFSCGKLDVSLAATVVRGIAEGCKISRCALIGGETAEMAGLYRGKDYDLAGVAIGAVPHGRTILPDTASMVAGDVLLGLASSGVHSNGFSLIRKIMERQHQETGLDYSSPAPWDPHTTIGQSILTPTRIYVRSLLKVLLHSQPSSSPTTPKIKIKGLSHITGGGLLENIPRTLPPHLTASLDATTWPRPPIFSWLQRAGSVPLEEMARVFNNGIGMVLVVGRSECAEVVRELEEEGEGEGEGGKTVYRIGELVERQEEEGEGTGCVLKNLDTWRK
ncbi:MAG: hypothetical protein Q9227_003015 [Pyrenula ochraceoflavens]